MPMLMPLLPSTPAQVPLTRIAAELGAAKATFYTKYPPFAAREREVPWRWCSSTQVSDIVADALLTNASVYLAVEKTAQQQSACNTQDEEGKSIRIPLQLPTLQERLALQRAKEQRLRDEIAQLDEIKRACDARSHAVTTRYVWGGLAALCMQWGAMARLTWWEYSWDVMEPIAYFMTFGTGIAGYLFFVLTRREYTYEIVSELVLSRAQRRQYERHGLDVRRYAWLVREIESSMRRQEEIHAQYHAGGGVVVS